MRLIIACLFTVNMLAGSAQSLTEIDRLSYLWSDRLYGEILAKARKKGDSATVLITKNLQAAEWMDQRKYSVAEDLLQQNLIELNQLSQKQQHRSKGDFSPLDTYNLIGRLYTETGNYRKALNVLTISQEKKTKAVNDRSGIMIRHRMTMARLHLRQEQWEIAEKTLIQLNKSLRSTRLKTQMVSEAYQIYLRGMATVYLRTNRIHEAGNFIKKAYSSYAPLTEHLFFRIPDSDADNELVMLKAEYLLRSGQSAAGLKLTSGSGNPTALRLTALYYSETGELERAFEYSKRLLTADLKEILEKFPLLTQDEQEAFGKKVDRDFFMALSLIHALDKSGKDTDFDFLLNFRLKYKGLRLSQSIRVLRFLQNSSDPSIQKYYSNLGRVKNELSRRALQKPIFEKDELKDRVEILRDSADLLERQIQLAFSKKIATQETAVDIEKLFDFLQSENNSSAAEIIRFEEVRRFSSEDSMVRYLILTLSNGKLKHAWLENGKELESRYLTLYRNSIVNRIPTTLTYEAFIKPVFNLTTGSNKIFLSVDGFFHLINPETLFDGEQYVLENTSITIVSNLSELMTTPDSAISGKGNIVFIARPSFDLNKEFQPVSKESLSRAVFLGDLKNEDFADLPGTEIEAHSSASHLEKNGYNVTILKGKMATEKEVKKLKSSQILHFATHGFFLEKSSRVNPMFESGLILAGINNSGEYETEDGILSAYEAAQLNLSNTEVVVLSACETGLGQVTASEGVNGLGRAFQLAGARTVIMSLWKVDDTGTQKLMTLFYENLTKTNDIHIAFRSAQLELKKDFPDPYFWGAFIITGR